MNHLLSLVAAGALLLTLTGCQPEATNTSPTPSASPSTSPSASPSPSFSPEALTCQNLVTPATWTALTSNGSVFSEGFVEKSRAEGSDVIEFVDRGGVACQWGYPGTDNVAVLAYSPISATDATKKQSKLEAEGWTKKTQPDGGTLFTKNTEGDMYEQAYVFRPGNWRYALDVSSLDRFAR